MTLADLLRGALVGALIGFAVFAGFFPMVRSLAITAFLLTSAGALIGMICAALAP